MRNSFLLAAFTFLLVGCNSNESKKMEINEKIMQLEKRIADRMDQRTKNKECRKDLIAKFQLSTTGNLSKAELSSRETQFQRQIDSLEIQESNCVINNLRDQFEIQKLKQEYQMY